jgi:ATP-dependent Clp protease adaptor protein ClpS
MVPTSYGGGTASGTWIGRLAVVVGGSRQNGRVPTTLEPVEVAEPDVDDVADVERPWIVIVWNDPVNLMSYVTFVFQKLFGYSLEKATELMLDVHEKGRAVVADGTREEAEMHVFRLHEHSLWATLEHSG